jgi:hypothetical protein
MSPALHFDKCLRLLASFVLFHYLALCEICHLTGKSPAVKKGNKAAAS